MNSAAGLEAYGFLPAMRAALGASLLFGAIVLMRMRAELARTKVDARLRRMAAQ